MNYPTFDFDKDRCQEFADSLHGTEEKLKYLRYCILGVTRDCKHIMGLDLGEDSTPSVERWSELSNPSNVVDYFFLLKFYYWAVVQVEYWEGIINLEPEAETAKIRWQGSEVQLIYLVTSLIENDFLPQRVRDAPFAFIENYFLNKDGKPLKKKQLSQTKYQYEGSTTRKPKKAQTLDHIVEETKKKNPKH